MDIDIGLLGALCREGMTSFYEYNIGQSMIDDRYRFVFIFIEDHWKQYKNPPTPETIRMETGVDVLAGPQEPLDFWCKKIRERSLYETVLGVLGEVSGLMQKSDPIKAFQAMQAGVYKIGQDVKMGDRPAPMFKNPQAIWDDYQKAKKGVIGVPTPWPSLNKITKGWQPADFALFAARPGSGKTWILLTIAVWAWRNNYKVLLGSTEMSHEALRRRAAALFCKLSYTALRDGSLSSSDEELYHQKLFELKSDERFLLLGDGFDVSVNSIEAGIIEHEPDLVCIDGVYHLRSSSATFDRRSDNYAEVFHQVKSLAKRRKVPIVGVTQMNRKDSSGGGENIDRLAFSDASTQLSDYIFFLTQTHDQKIARELELKPVKLREADFMGSIKINWRFDTQDFSEILNEQEIVVSVPSAKPQKGPGGFKVHDVPADDPW